jgi:CheY-like chemotaxis protein
LVVDDEPGIVELLALLLDGADRSILGANAGDTALQIARQQHPDLVISDVMMPRMDGRELCRAIKADPQLSSTRVLLMSALHNLDLRDCGQDALIPKPFGIRMMERTVGRLLADSDARES